MKFDRTNHRKLWYWLADNPEMEKEEWPEWDDFRDDDGNIKVTGECFACEYKKKTDGCPFMIYCCDYNIDQCLYGSYIRWERSTGETRANLARTIAELPVREGVECI